MYSLLDKMFIKRFCLPSNSDITTYEKGDASVPPCLCGNYYHIACILQKEMSIKKMKILSFGINEMGDEAGLKPGIHAEHNALNKLPYIKNKNINRNQLETINLLVIRLSRTNNLQSSKPCGNCIYKMKIFPKKKGYKIQYIYYSDGKGHIVRTTLDNLENEEKHYSRFYIR